MGSLPLLDSFLVTPVLGLRRGGRRLWSGGSAFAPGRWLWAAVQGCGASSCCWVPAAHTASCAQARVVTAWVTGSVPSAHSLGSVGPATPWGLQLEFGLEGVRASGPLACFSRGWSTEGHCRAQSVLVSQEKHFWASAHSASLCSCPLWRDVAHLMLGRSVSPAPWRMLGWKHPGGLWGRWRGGGSLSTVPRVSLCAGPVLDAEPL